MAGCNILPIIGSYIPVKRLAEKVEEALNLYWYHPGNCYKPGPITESFLEKFQVKLDCGNSRTLVGRGRQSEQPPKDWYITVFPHILPDDSPLSFRGIVCTNKVQYLPNGWLSQVEECSDYNLGRSVDPIDNNEQTLQVRFSNCT